MPVKNGHVVMCFDKRIDKRVSTYLNLIVDLPNLLPNFLVLLFGSFELGFVHARRRGSPRCRWWLDCRTEFFLHQTLWVSL